MHDILVIIRNLTAVAQFVTLCLGRIALVAVVVSLCCRTYYTIKKCLIS